MTFGAVSQSRVEVDEGDDPAKMLVKSLECTQASSSSSSSLDWARAEAELTSKPGLVLGASGLALPGKVCLPPGKCLESCSQIYSFSVWYTWLFSFHRANELRFVFP